MVLIPSLNKMRSIIVAAAVCATVKAHGSHGGHGGINIKDSAKDAVSSASSAVKSVASSVTAVEKPTFTVSRLLIDICSVGSFD